MGWLNAERPPDKYSAAYIKLFVERLRTAVNYIDENNFPNPLNADAILKDKTLGLTKLYGVEFQHTLLTLATPHTSDKEELVNVGPFYHWSNVWGNNVKLVFEVTGGSQHEDATATFELHGADGLLASVESKEGAKLEFLRSEEFDPPGVSQTFLVKMKTSDSTHAAMILGARLIIMVK